MTGRTKEETNGVTLLGNQHTNTRMTMTQRFWKHSSISIQTTIILSSLTVQNLQAFVRLPDSRTLQPSIFPMCRMKSWWKVSR